MRLEVGDGRAGPPAERCAWACCGSVEAEAASVRSPSDVPRGSRRREAVLLGVVRLSGRVPGSSIQEGGRVQRGSRTGPGTRPAQRRACARRSADDHRRRVHRGLSSSWRFSCAAHGRGPRGAKSPTACSRRLAGDHPSAAPDPFGCFADRELPSAGLTSCSAQRGGEVDLLPRASPCPVPPHGLPRPQAGYTFAPSCPPPGETRSAWSWTSSWPAAGISAEAGGCAGERASGPAGRVHAADSAVQQALEGFLRARQGHLHGGAARLPGGAARTIEALESDRTHRSPTSPTSCAPRCSRPPGSLWMFSARCLRTARGGLRELGPGARQPRNNRGIENLWKKPVGEVLEAWYAKERPRQSASAARAWERQLDELKPAEGRILGSRRAGRLRERQREGRGRRPRTGQARGGEGTARLEIAALTQVAAQWPVAQEQPRAASGAIAEWTRRDLEQERGPRAGGERPAPAREGQRVARRKTQAGRRAGSSPLFPAWRGSHSRRPGARRARSRGSRTASRQGSSPSPSRGARISASPCRRTCRAGGQVTRGRPGAPSPGRGRIRIVHPDMEIEVGARPTPRPGSRRPRKRRRGRRCPRRIRAPARASGIPVERVRAAARQTLQPRRGPCRGAGWRAPLRLREASGCPRSCARRPRPCRRRRGAGQAQCRGRGEKARPRQPSRAHRGGKRRTAAAQI